MQNLSIFLLDYLGLEVSSKLLGINQKDDTKRIIAIAYSIGVAIKVVVRDLLGGSRIDGYYFGKHLITLVANNEGTS